MGSFLFLFKIVMKFIFAISLAFVLVAFTEGLSKDEIVQMLRIHGGSSEEVIRCVLKKLRLQSPLRNGNSLDAVKTLEEPLGREKRHLGKELTDSEVIDRKHCKGEWLVVCETAEACKNEIDLHYSKLQNAVYKPNRY